MSWSRGLRQPFQHPRRPIVGFGESGDLIVIGTPSADSSPAEEIAYAQAIQDIELARLGSGVESGPDRPAESPTIAWEAVSGRAECPVCHGSGFMTGFGGEPEYCDYSECGYWAPRET